MDSPARTAWEHVDTAMRLGGATLVAAALYAPTAMPATLTRPVISRLYTSLPRPLADEVARPAKAHLRLASAVDQNAPYYEHVYGLERSVTTYGAKQLQDAALAAVYATLAGQPEHVTPWRTIVEFTGQFDQLDEPAQAVAFTLLRDADCGLIPDAIVAIARELA